MLSPRQEKAQAISEALRLMGAATVTPLPLADGASLRFRVLATRAEAIVQELRDKNWDPRYIGSGPEFHLSGATPLSHTYEIHLLVERTAVPDGRIVQAELASSATKRSSEVEAMLKSIGFK